MMLTEGRSCAFCQKPQQDAHCYEGFLVPRIGETSVLICGKCVGICRKILQKEIKKQSRKS